MDHSDVSSNELPIYEMIDHVSDGIYITCNGKFVFVNKKMMEMFELSKEEIIGMPSWNLAIPEKREEIRKTMIRLVGERNTTPVEIECLTKSGHKIIVEIRYSGLVDADKVFGIVIDITKRKQIEKELINAKHKAEENDRLKSAFLANMSHEIRTPMNAIIGFSALLSKRTVDEEKKNIYIKYITESCQQLLVLVNDILDVSKIETKQLSICLSKVNVNNLLNEIYSVFSEQVNL